MEILSAQLIAKPARKGHAKLRLWLLLLFCLSGTLALAACSGLPAAGPTSSDIIDQSKASLRSSSKDVLRFPVIRIDPKTLRALQSEPKTSLHATFGDTPSDKIWRIEPGDHVNITIWEVRIGGPVSAEPATGNAGLLAQNSQIPNQIVGSDGTVFIPYAGQIRIAGLTPEQAENAIRRRLRGKAAEPQVLITLDKRLSDSVTVSGDDINGGIEILSPNADRLLDVIAMAGGIRGPAPQAQIKLIRGNRSATVGFASVLANADENIHLHPGDTILVSKNINFFTVIGASGKNAQVPFDTDRVSLAQALGLAGGLLDERSDAAGIFVFRYEMSSAAKELCGSCAKSGGAVPIVYRLDMDNAQSFFTAQSFLIRNHDVLYIADAPKLQLQKFLAMVRDLTSPILTGAILNRSVNH